MSLNFFTAVSFDLRERPVNNNNIFIPVWSQVLPLMIYYIKMKH